MQVLKLLLLVCLGFFLLEVSGRRRCCCCSFYKQEMRTKSILATPRLSLYKEDYITSSGAYNRDMCGYLNSRMLPNGSFPLDRVDEFSQHYMAFIYNEVNFPLTYRSKGVYLNTSAETIRRYRWHYCVPFDTKVSNFFIWIVVFWFVFICLPLCIIGLFESLARRLRRGRLF
jgi:hypothetical protein